MIDVIFDNSKDDGYDPIVFDTTDPLKIYLEQIKMCFESGVGEIMNSLDPIDLEHVVFEQNLSEQEINNIVRNRLASFCSMYEYFDTEINVFFSMGEMRDTCLIKINIDKISYKIIIK
jgi:hypothetical protein